MQFNLIKNLVDFLTMLPICKSHEKLLEMVTPKYCTSVEKGTIISLISIPSKLEISVVLTYLEESMIMAFVLFGFSNNLFLADHSTMQAMSELTDSIAAKFRTGDSAYKLISRWHKNHFYNALDTNQNPSEIKRTAEVQKWNPAEHPPRDRQKLNSSAAPPDP